jgi:hypothetical protein
MPRRDSAVAAGHCMPSWIMVVTTAVTASAIILIRMALTRRMRSSQIWKSRCSDA